MTASVLLDGLFSTPPVSAALGDEAVLQAMLDFEAALAGAEAACGVIPPEAAATIAAACRADGFDVPALSQQAMLGGNLAIPLVKALTARVAERDAGAARWVHWGATSQDVIDTATVLRLRASLAAIEVDLVELTAALARLAGTQRDKVMAGRTWLQHALPVPFGLKAAGWLHAVRDARNGLSTAAAAARVLQFGGAAGTLASLGDRGLAVAHGIASRLDLMLPPAPWHTDRTRLAAVAAALGILCGALGKIARDVSLLMQTEVAEAFEPSSVGRGGSSTMPHKRNPVGCAIALSAAIQAPPLVATMLAAMVQEHERGLGGWHAEWQTLPALLRLSAASAAQMSTVAAGLELAPLRMRTNLDQTGGMLLAEAVSMALAEHVGKAEAHRLVEQASRRALRDGASLRESLAADPAVSAHLSASGIAALMVPDTYLGMADHFINAILAEAVSDAPKKD